MPLKVLVPDKFKEPPVAAIVAFVKVPPEIFNVPEDKLTVPSIVSPLLILAVPPPTPSVLDTVKFTASAIVSPLFNVILPPIIFKVPPVASNFP